MLFHKAFLLIFFSFGFVSYSQNLISNPGFENTNLAQIPCIEGGSSLECNLSGVCWVSMIRYGFTRSMPNTWSAPTSGNADIFHINTDEPCSLFSHWFDSTHLDRRAHTGEYFAGSMVYFEQPIPYPVGAYWSEPKEYLQNKLTEPLEVNEKYCISMYVSYPQRNILNTSGLGVVLLDTLTFPDQPNGPMYTLYAEPDVEFGYLELDDKNWYKLESSFTAKSNSEYAIFGIFKKREELERNLVKGMENYDSDRLSSYYLYDDFNLEKVINELEISGDIIYCPATKGRIVASGMSDYWWESSLNPGVKIDEDSLFDQSINQEQDLIVHGTSCGNYQLTDTIHVCIFSVEQLQLEDTVLCPNEAYEIHLPDYVFSADWSDSLQGVHRVLSHQGVFNISAIDTNGCVLNDSFTLDFEKRPFLEVPLDTVRFCEKYNYQIKEFYGLLNWSNGASGDKSSLDKEDLILITSSNRCGIDSAYVFAEKLAEIMVPNIITPNNDDKNECLYVQGLENLSNSFQVYSRWGEEVFKAENYKNDWCPNELSDGTYYYHLKVDGCPDNKGMIYIVR